MLNRDGVRGLIVGLLLGTALGFFLAHYSRASPPVTTTVTTPPAPGPDVARQSRIFAAQQAVLADPGNTEAWIALGNDYFDAHEPRKAVDAYAKALALKPDDPDVLTDQGVMFRELKLYDQAIANWLKAQELDPKHLQSLYNLGIVYAYDVGMPAKARQAWMKVMERAPGSPQAAQAREALAKLGPNP